jgi:hypothetical protein
VSSSKSVSQGFTARLVNEDPSNLTPAASMLKDIFKQYHKSKAQHRRTQRKVASRIGFKERNINSAGLPNDVPIIEVERLPTPYPPEGHIVLERYYPVLPSAPGLRDPTCSYLHTYCQLDESKLQHTVEMDQDAIFIDKTTQMPVVIVLRNLAKDYYDIIGPKAVELVLDSIYNYRSHFVLRNNPGKMAAVGVTAGQQSKSVFGWVRNLKLRANLQHHQYNISSLFGYFYALIRGRIPYICACFEEAMKGTDIPRLDPSGSKQFTLPFDEQNITFVHHPLAPPEGYISHNFSCGIHKETY